MQPRITINLVVMNGEQYIRQCLDSIMSQTYSGFEVNILNNASTDRTLEIAREYFSHDSGFMIHDSSVNLGTWGGFEELLKYSHGEYIVCLSVDILFNPDFLKNAVLEMEKDENIGALQPKVLRWYLKDGKPEFTNIIDTLGFKIFKSRRVINYGHGEVDKPEYNQKREIFGVEGAVPVFRKIAFEDCRILGLPPHSQRECGGEIMDHEMWWYGDDIDLAWRMRLFGWKEIYAPNVLAYHDRSTTHGLSKNKRDFIKMRRMIPIKKRRLDYRNTILTFIKNDYLSNIIKDAPAIFVRQIGLWAYFMIYEPSMYLELFNICKLLPIMLKKRREVMRKAKVSAKEMRPWFE
jgi:GT2 family glycosyltransferase